MTALAKSAKSRAAKLRGARPSRASVSVSRRNNLSSGEISFSFIAARRTDGQLVLCFPSREKMVEIEIDEPSADRALNLHTKLRQSKGRDGDGKLLYTDSALFLRPKTNRRLHFS